VSDLPPPPPPSGNPPPPPGGGYGGEYQGGYGGGYGPQFQKVGPWMRLLARIIDGLVLLIPNLIISAAVGGGTTVFQAGTRAWIASVISTALTLAYFVWLESSKGQSVGKMALSMRVVGPNGQLPTVEQALKRNAWLLLSIIPILGGFAGLVIAIAIAVTISNDAAGRGLHDNFAGGTVVTKQG
jgi:uncharacterized RDD family membrane protein YckC